MKVYILTMYDDDAFQHIPNLDEVFLTERDARLRRIELYREFKQSEAWERPDYHYYSCVTKDVTWWNGYKKVVYRFDLPLTEPGIDIEEVEVH